MLEGELNPYQICRPYSGYVVQQLCAVHFYLKASAYLHVCVKVYAFTKAHTWVAHISVHFWVYIQYVNILCVGLYVHMLRPRVCEQGQD